MDKSIKDQPMYSQLDRAKGRIKQLEEAKKQVFIYLEKHYLTSSAMGEIKTLYNSILEGKDE